MKVLGITNSNDEYSSDFLFLKHALSLFHLIPVEISNGNNEGKCVLNVVTINVNKDYLNLLNSLSRIPVFILVTSSTEVSQSEIDCLRSTLEANNLEIWGEFIFENLQLNFSDQMINTDQKLELIRKINAIQYKKLKLKDDDHFTCGIDRSRNPCGDASEY